MKRMFLCLMAMVCVLTLSAQSSYENEVIKNIMARRSIRKYLDKPVEHAKLEVIVRAGSTVAGSWHLLPARSRPLPADEREV